MFFSLAEIVKLASIKSIFYSALYKDINTEDFSLEDLPIVEQDKFWQSNTYKDNKLLTEALGDGVIFKSGGTTGAPKFSVYTKEEWQSFTTLFGKGMDKKCLKNGDKIGNLFYSGDLYASFLFITKALENSEKKIIQFPMTGGMELEDIIKSVAEYKLNVLAGVPTTFISLAKILIERGETLKLERILYGGEAFFPEQKIFLSKAFPKTEFLSIGYASVDAGHLGYIDEECAFGEHRVFDGSIMEIVDEFGEVITDYNRTGKLIYTNLARSLMPIIRYPVGDLAEWTGPNKFLLLGRSDEGARIGPVTVNRDDMVLLFRSLGLLNEILNFQMLIDRQNGKDSLSILYTSSVELTGLKESFYRERKMFKQAVNAGHINEINFKKVNESELEHNPRTGKLKLVIDRRH